MALLRNDGAIDVVDSSAEEVAIRSTPDIVSAAYLVDDAPERCRAFLRDILTLVAERSEDRLLLLVKWRAAPISTSRFDGPVVSFACSGDLFRRHFVDSTVSTRENLLFNTLSTAIERCRAGKIWAVQYPVDLPALFAICDEKTPSEADWVIPHAGELRHLRSCLMYARAACSHNAGKLLVGVDEFWGEEHRKFAETFQDCYWYRSLSPSSGPYIVKNFLAKVAEAPYLCFQDSDDVPCTNRLSLLSLLVGKEGVAMGGSHEIRFNVITRSVNAVRYPLDVNSCFAHGGGTSPFLHGTGMILRRAFIDAGCFSTEYRFSMDTHFLYRCQFSLKIRNIDAFLYVRRVHPASLTNATATHRDSVQRLVLFRRFQRALSAVRTKKVELIESDLMPTLRPNDSEPLIRINPR